MKPKKVSLSGKEKSIQDVWKWYECQLKLSNQYKRQILLEIQNTQEPSDITFFGMTREEIEEFFYELDYLTMLNLLASAEAAIQIDFLDRVEKRRKDSISKHFYRVYQQSRGKVYRVPEILDIWKDFDSSTKSKISDFNGALNLRHWLAHGRYWTPKLGKDYSPDDVYDIAYRLLEEILR